jgi:DNA-binding NtrC family response regulator
MTTPRPLSTHVAEIGPGRLELDAAELRVVGGPDKGARVRLGSTTLAIGSAPDSGLPLHDPTVSSRHAEVLVEARGYVIRDLGSKNGVLLHGWPIERAPLCDRMQLRLGRSTLQVRALGLRDAIPLVTPGTFGALVAHSVKMRAAVATLAQLAASDVTVLLEGETGAGKEVAARALHDLGARARAPFCVFDCGAVAPALIAAELFGHERGAFSGADAARAGLFEQAEGGTLFCDEIGELPLDLQPMLLRAIETRSIRRVGGAGERRCDVRVVAATNRNLEEEVRAGRFRKDLFYRLAVARLRLPPLRERPEDIPVLARHFAAELGVVLPVELGAVLSSHGWPGNVRELRNVIARLAAQPASLGELLPAAGGARDPLFDGARLRPLSEARGQAGDEFERRYLTEALARADGNISAAAELAGVSRQLFTKLVAKHGLRWRDRQSST